MAAECHAPDGGWGVDTPRPLTRREREVLDVLLCLEVPGAAELRAQAPHAQVVNGCPCGCPTVELLLDRSAARAATAARTPIFSWARAARASRSSYHVVLFVAEGWLSELEYVPLSEPVPTEFPALDELAEAVSGEVALGPVGTPLR